MRFSFSHQLFIICSAQIRRKGFAGILAESKMTEGQNPEQKKPSLVQISFQPPFITLAFMRSLKVAKNDRTRQNLTQVV